MKNETDATKIQESVTKADEAAKTTRQNANEAQKIAKQNPTSRNKLNAQRAENQANAAERQAAQTKTAAENRIEEINNQNKIKAENIKKQQESPNYEAGQKKMEANAQKTQKASQTRKTNNLTNDSRTQAKMQQMKYKSESELRNITQNPKANKFEKAAAKALLKEKTTSASAKVTTEPTAKTAAETPASAQANPKTEVKPNATTESASNTQVKPQGDVKPATKPHTNDKRPNYEDILKTKNDKPIRTKWADSYLNEEELDALNKYYEDYGINGQLRSGKIHEEEMEMLKALDSGFNKAPALEESATVYRAIHEGVTSSSTETKFINSIKEGSIIENKGYTSTATMPDSQFSQFAGQVANGQKQGYLMKISLPKGTKGMFGGHNEYLLPRDARIMVNSIETVNGIKVANCEYMLP